MFIDRSPPGISSGGPTLCYARFRPDGEFCLSRSVRVPVHRQRRNSAIVTWAAFSVPGFKTLHQPGRNRSIKFRHVLEGGCDVKLRT